MNYCSKFYNIYLIIFMNKELLGQVFTPKTIVDKMINLITISEPQLVLEPSSGSGIFIMNL
ncbi:N-6 DNA methylase [Mycoplasma sp. T230T]|nr:N-6 DNA methylase [Mycoplasma bradburyae]